MRTTLRVGLGMCCLGLVTSTACSSKPPPDFAPQPGLVARIAEIRMHTSPAPACPGHTIHASYDALLDDGTMIPFSTRYDEDDPPPLHVMFLGRSSPEARLRDNGGWDTDPDPLVSAMTGFRLRAFLRADPSLSVETMVEPEYSCVRHAFSFRGRRGRRGQAGFPGPDVTVRLDVLASPFYDELLVASVEVGDAPPRFVVADGAIVPPADWLIVETRGGDGGRGVDGADGAEGEEGQDGCPAGAGGAGGRGGIGGPGGPGGPGGRVTVIVPDDQPLLAGLVDAFSVGGRGGAGGEAGEGGPGGEGGRGVTGNRRCANGAAGPAGENGAEGAAGPNGRHGPRAQVITVPREDVFGRFVPEELQLLLSYRQQQGR